MKLNTIKNIAKKLKDVLIKNKLWIVGLIIFLYPFYCLLFNELTGNNFGELYTFGLPLKDFMAVWVALGGIIGIVSNIILTQKRITIQEDQQKEQQKQFEAQILLQQKQQRDTRFASGVELLGNANESARIGGVYNLYFIANEYSDEYLDTVCEILCAHIRTITRDKKYQAKYAKESSNEIQTILDLLFREDKNGKLIFNACFKNLSGTFLCGTNFFKATLSNVGFKKAKLSDVGFKKAELNNIDFLKAELRKVYLGKAELRKVYFREAELNDVNFCYAKLSDVNFGEAELSNINFGEAKLSNVSFGEAELSNIYFAYAKLEEGTVYFHLTKLEGFSYEEITTLGRSLKLTKTDDNLTGTAELKED